MHIQHFRNLKPTHNANPQHTEVAKLQQLSSFKDYLVVMASWHGVFRCIVIVTCNKKPPQKDKRLGNCLFDNTHTQYPIAILRHDRLL